MKTKIRISKALNRSGKEVEIYIPEVRIDGKWKRAISKHTVIYKETQDSKNPKDQKELAEFYLEIFVKKYNECTEFLNNI